MIFGQKVKLYFKDLGAAQICGYFEPTKKEIVIHSKLDKKLRDVTLMHEFIHAHFDRQSYRKIITIEVEELISDQLAKSLCENFDIRIKK